MSRKLNPDFMRRTMLKDSLAGLEAVFLTGEQFGVSVCNESLLSDPINGWVDDDAPERYSRDRQYYQGWTVPGRLYCVKCWQQMSGVPRELILANRCHHCGEALYAMDDARLDSFGFMIYRDRVKRYTGIAVRRFLHLIEGGEYIQPGERLAKGYHKDHAYPIRAAFERDVAESIVGAPINICVIPAKQNLSKGSKCNFDASWLLGRYGEFIAAYPEWNSLVSDSDSREPLFIA